MKESFAGYYAPTDEEYKRLWGDALIVLDTNTLLDLYRFPQTARDEFLAALELVKDRLWIPHQVGLEFQRQRSNVIGGERLSSESALGSIERMIGEARTKVEGLEIDKRGLGIETKPLFDELDKIGQAIKEAVTKVRDSQPNISQEEPVRVKLDELFHGRVGPAPASQADLDALTDGGQIRFDASVPPGYADKDKDKNPNSASFVFDGIVYQRKFGDLILWRQLIHHAKAAQVKSIMLITSERKEDWWWIEQGRTLGPRPELVREIMRDGQVEIFWMYAPDQFLRHSKTYTKAKVSEQSVDEIAHALIQPYIRNRIGIDVIPASLKSENIRSFSRINDQNAILALADWLEGSGRNVEITHDFPDILVDGGIGFEIKFQRNFKGMIFSPNAVNAILRGYHAVHEGNIDQFVLVIIIEESDFTSIKEEDKISDLNERLMRLVKRYSIDGIVVGTLLYDSFEFLTAQYGQRGEFDSILG